VTRFSVRNCNLKWDVTYHNSYQRSVSSNSVIAVMADVRSLLRSERASRRIQHVHASYSTSGALVCLVCHITLKAESLWELHLKSADHVKRLQKLRDGKLENPPEAPPPTNSTNGGRKRKAGSEEELGQERKKAKPAVEGVPVDFFDVGKEPENHEAIEDPKEEKVVVQEKASEIVETQLAKPQAAGLPPGFFDASSKGAASATTTVDEDEWAAFERDVATLPAETSVPSALTAAATITAAPLSAAELAARTTAEASTQKELKEAELEGEREDAARQLEDELDQMEELEDRVRRLRAKREELRQKREGSAMMQMDTNGGRAGVVLNDDERATENAGEDEDEDDDDNNDVEDEWDDWRLRD